MSKLEKRNEIIIFQAARKAQKDATRLPKNRVAPTPPPMRLTDLDIQLMISIWRYEGVMTVDQMAFLTGVSAKAILKRLTRLYHNVYVKRVDATNRERATREGVYWLLKKGAYHVAQAVGTERRTDFAYRKEPKWQTLNHDLKLNDFRLRFERNLRAIPGAELLTWVSDYEFHQSPDRIRIARMSRGFREVVRRDQEIMPDGYCHFTLPVLADGKARDHYRLLIELDLATETRRGQFGRDKVIPLSAYLESAAYEQRFGTSGGVLVVTTTPARLANLRRQTAACGKRNYFRFCTFDQLEQAANVICDPIWVTAWDETPRALRVG